MENQTINQPLPQEYKQYQTINFCSNTLINLKYLIVDNGFVPILIGSGDFPRVWVYAKKENNAIAIVRDSVAALPTVKVNIFSREKKLSIEITLSSNSESTKIIEIDFGIEVPSVNYIDLKPIGYNIFGDRTELNIGGNKLQNNTFEGLQALFKIGENININNNR